MVYVETACLLGITFCLRNYYDDFYKEFCVPGLS